jgi:CheY-like chemotaxis protein
MTREEPVLIIDGDSVSVSELRACLEEHGLAVETIDDGFAAMEMLGLHRYRAIVLDPMIRHRLNGYAVLNYIELHQPAMLPYVFLLTGMSRQTILRTAPVLVQRLFRKPAEVRKVAAAVIASIEPRAVPDRPRTNRSVLLVEDDPLTAKVTSQALEEMGYACQWLASGAKVLATATTSTFDVIMLDLAMPGMDGFTVLERLKSRKPHLLRRVVVTTGMPAKYLDHLDRERICGVVQKPIDLEELQRVLELCAQHGSFEGGGEPPASYDAH